jgi:dolichol-phosphate mannosyltransferase
MPPGLASQSVNALVIIPTYQEAGNIETVLRQVRQGSPAAEVLVVDDASPDGTADMAEEAGADLGGICVLRREGKGGLGSAYRAGFSWGLAKGFDALVEMDADLSHDPTKVPDILAGLAHAELSIGSRYIPGGSIPAWARHRRLLSQVGNRYSAAMLGLRIADLTSGFRAYRAETLTAIDMSQVQTDGYGFQIEMAYEVARAGGRITEVPIRFVDRTEGESKMSVRIAMEALGLVTTIGIKRWASLAGSRPGVSPSSPGESPET